MTSSSSVVICACARNVEPFLTRSIVRINQFIRVFESRVNPNDAIFKASIVIVYSTHNQDNTVSKLQEWASADPRVVLLPDGVETPSPYSSINLTTARNTYMEHIQRLSESDESSTPEYMIVLDIDDRLADYAFDLVGLARCLDYSSQWDALSVLTTPYYDRFALRDPRINLRNQYEGIRLGFPEEFTLQTMCKHLKEWEQLPDDQATPSFISVLSAFGACTIYRWEVVKHCVYSYKTEYSAHDELPDCEHFAFYLDMKKKGGKLVLSPSFRSRPG